MKWLPLFLLVLAGCCVPKAKPNPYAIHPIVASSMYHTLDKSVDVPIHLLKTNNFFGSVRWYVWADHPTNQLWAIQGNTKPADRTEWFTLPQYEDNGTRVSANVANVPLMIFRATRKR